MTKPKPLEPLRGFLHRVKESISPRRPALITGLHVVRDPPEAEIDIVAVHGLGDQGFGAWTTQDHKTGTSQPWLEALLGADIPRARIMTYSFVTGDKGHRYIVYHLIEDRAFNLTESLAAHRRRDCTAHRPLFFIAHSLGGWIVQRAVILSSESTDPITRWVETSTCGVAFFGTIAPGRPLSPSPLEHVISRTSGHQNDSQPPMQLQSEDYQWLERQMSAFKFVAADVPRISFHETKKSGDSFVVENMHSMTGSDGTQIGLAASHSDLISFYGRDANYTVFIAKFREMVSTGIRPAVMEAKRNAIDMSDLRRIDYECFGYAVPYHVPNGPEHIVPRDDIMQQIESVFNADPKKVRPSFRSVHLSGDSGTGKTTLAKHYIQLHRNELSSVLWVRAESWETAAASYLDFANSLVTFYSSKMPDGNVEKRLGVTGIAEMIRAKSVLDLDKARVMSVVRAVKDWLLQPDNSNWLIVFDGIVPIYNFEEFISLTLSGRVILTSREQEICSWGRKVLVQSMSEDQALELFSTVTRGPIHSTLQKNGTQIKAGKCAAERLKLHPQAMAQAASAIRMKNILGLDYERITATPLHHRLFGSTIEQHPAGNIILRISALLASSAIPASLFLGSLQNTACIPPRCSKSAGVLKSIQTQKYLRDVLQHLMEQGFILPVYTCDSSQPSSPSDSPSSPLSTSSASLAFFTMDTDARDFVRNNLSEDDMAEYAWLACSICVDGVRKASDNKSATIKEVQEFGRIMVPHAKICNDECLRTLLEPVELRSISWHVLGNVCRTQGAINNAIRLFKLALKYTDSMNPSEKAETALSLSQVLEDDEQTNESIKVLTEVKLFSVDTALRFRVTRAKANGNITRGDFGTAERQLSALEQEQDKALGPCHAETVSTVRLLAYTLHRMDKTEAAHMLYRRVYFSYQNAYGLYHPMTLNSLDDLAYISREIFAIDAAEAFWTQSIDIKTRCLGHKHPRTAMAIQNVADVDDLRARFSFSRFKYQKALDLLVATLGRAHPNSVNTRLNFARSLHLQAQFIQHLFPQTGAVTPSPSSALRALSRRHRRRMSDEAFYAQAYDPSHLEMAREQSLRDSERVYLQVMTIKNAARDLYSDRSVMRTVTELIRVYEANDFFAAEMAEKIAKLTTMCHERSRRDTA